MVDGRRQQWGECDQGERRLTGRDVVDRSGASPANRDALLRRRMHE